MNHNEKIKSIIIDIRMKKIYKEYFEKLGYNLIELPVNTNTYYEIAAHPDIFALKIYNNLILEESIYNKKYIQNNQLNFSNINVICGNKIKDKYPADVMLNACFLEQSNVIIHNFKYSDPKLNLLIDNYKTEKIQVKQGYTNCSIVVIDEKSIITQDKGIYNELRKYNFDVLLLEKELDIKLLSSKSEFSNMNGFIGGAMCRLKDKIVLFGDIEKIDKEYVIRDFISKRNLNLISFENEEVMDYGGIVVI